MFDTWRQQHRQREQLALLRPRLQRMALAWCGDPSLADDLTQEALARALGSLERLRREQALEGWAFSILANCFRDHCRRSRPTEPYEERIDTTQAGAERDLARQQTSQQVRNAITRLSPAQREVLMLVDLESCSYAEVAAILDIPVGTVMSRLSRARQNLKGVLAEAALRPTGARPPLERVK
ncbi:MAG: RNA polymerase sigma factor [Sedimenticola sp.]|nr:RNA polymerase sigma factor [Sedimenticola sp.]